MGDIILKTENLFYTYSEGLPGENTVLKGVSLEIEKGEFLGIIGHTGSGKSTLIQHFNGLLKPTKGKVFIDGNDIWEDRNKLREYRFRVGLVFQYPEYQLFEETVYKDIAFGPKNMSMSEEDIDKRVRDAIRFVGLEESILEESPFELSGGQKRRVAIAGVIAMDPEVLILDEPAAGLDPLGRAEILSQIKQYHQQHGGTVIIVSHSMEDIAKYASKVLVLNEGEVFAYDSLEKVFMRAQELENMGLAIPVVTKIMQEISDKGYDVNRLAFTAEAAVSSLMKLLKS